MRGNIPFIENRLVFTMPLTLKAHQIANQFRQQQSTLQRAKQVYLNTLAVQTVAAYLSWLGIETDLTTSDSWNPFIQVLADTADLVVKGKGKLECRPVLPGETICRVPPEVWSDRIGYVAVQFDAELREGFLLGFTPCVSSVEVPLSQLRSLDELVDRLTEPVSATKSKAPVILSHWLQGMVTAGWQTAAELFGMQPLTWSFRSISQLQPTELPDTLGKMLNLDVSPGCEPIALLVGVTPMSPVSMNIWVKICPTGSQVLPEALEVLLLDTDGIAVMQAQARNTEMIQLRFSGAPGEQFSIKVAFGAHSTIEDFII